MTTAVCFRNPIQTMWSSIFPKEQVTFEQSTLFVKKLLAVAISNIAYLRAIFPEHAFGDRKLEDLHLKILRDDSDCQGASQLIKWIKGSFDALDKKYLFTDINDAETLIESYTFRFSYSEEDVSTSLSRNNQPIVTTSTTQAETRRATIGMLRTVLLLAQTLTALPEKVLLTMKLLYYDEVTPADYEPPGFKACQIDTFNYVEETVNIKIGDVSTPFHSVKLRIKTNKKQFAVIDEHGELPNIMETSSNKLKRNNSENVELSVSPCNTSSVSVTPFIASDRFPCENISAQSPFKPEPTVSTNKQRVETENLNVNCPCGLNEDDGLMIICAICKSWQHAVCFKILKEEDAPKSHICEKCSLGSNGNYEMTDSSLIGQNDVPLQATCLWRRALFACSEFSHVRTSTFSSRLGIQNNIAAGILNRLETEGYIKTPNNGRRNGPKEINKELLLSHGFPKYFGKTTFNEADIINLTNQTEKLNVNSTKCNQKNEETKVFEISSSVEFGDEDELPTKKRKSSITEEPLIV